MKKIFLFAFAFAFFSSFSPLAIAADKITHITICDDDGEWPPYNYYDPNKGGKAGGVLIGYALDTVKHIMTKNNISYKIIMSPWNRCVNNVMNFQEDYSIVLQFSSNPQREKDFIMSKPFYTTNSSIFFTKKKHPGGLNIKTLADLKKYKACGISGYNYKSYGLDEKDVDQGAKTLDQVASKVKADRCDFFIEKFEIVSGFEKTGGAKIISDPEMSHEMLSMVPETPFHMGISRKNPQGQAIADLMNKEIDAMEKDGSFKQLQKKWVGN